MARASRNDKNVKEFIFDQYQKMRPNTSAPAEEEEAKH